MADATLVDVLYPRNDLLKELARLWLFKFLAFNDEVEKFSSACILHYKKQLPRCFNNLKIGFMR